MTFTTFYLIGCFIALLLMVAMVILTNYYSDSDDKELSNEINELFYTIQSWKIPIVIIGMIVVSLSWITVGFVIGAMFLKTKK